MAHGDDLHSPNSDAARSAKMLVVGIVALCLLRAAAAGLLPVSADEAYYWLWSKHLSAGYLDHPPAIALLIRGGTSLFGATAVGVRLTCLVASLIATWLIWQCAV